MIALIFKQKIKHMAESHKYGAFGEDYAADYLKSKGYEILDRHWRTGHKEVDIVARIDDMIVFVEVKTRLEEWQCKPMDLISNQKIRNITQAAHAYVRYHRWDWGVRFDLITIFGGYENPVLTHYEGAFRPLLSCR